MATYQRNRGIILPKTFFEVETLRAKLHKLQQSFASAENKAKMYEQQQAQVKLLQQEIIRCRHTLKNAAVWNFVMNHRAPEKRAHEAHPKPRVEAARRLTVRRLRRRLLQRRLRLLRLTVKTLRRLAPRRLRHRRGITRFTGAELYERDAPHGSVAFLCGALERRRSLQRRLQPLPRGTQWDAPYESV